MTPRHRPEPRPVALSVAIRYWREPRGAPDPSRRARHHAMGSAAALLAAATARTVGPGGPAMRPRTTAYPVPGSPWPRDVVGSVSHTAGCAAAVASADRRILAVGVDVETVHERHVALFERMDRLAGALEPPPDAAAEATVTWTVREAVYKCAYPFFGPGTPALACAVGVGEHRSFATRLADPRGHGPPLTIRGRYRLSAARAGALCWVAEFDDDRGDGHRERRRRAGPSPA